VDLLLKVVLRRAIDDRVVSLGWLGSLRLVAAPVWLARVSGERHVGALWFLWGVAAGILLIFASWIPLSHVFAGLLLGGSLSNALESTWRGRVSDYVCLTFWPAFNLADLAIIAGAVGLVVDLVATIRAASFGA
jgi:lipoprotein signal peptidase